MARFNVLSASKAAATYKDVHMEARQCAIGGMKAMGCYGGEASRETGVALWQQMSRALLLSRKAEADAKPELEIYADDVICAHGAMSQTLTMSAP